MTDRPAPPKAVLFDMDGVLCDYHIPTRIAGLSAATGVAEAEIVRRIWASGFERAGDAGRFTTGEYLAGFAECVGVPVDRATWIATRKAAMTPWPAMLDLARRIAGRMPVALLSNNGPLVREALAELFPEVAEIFGDRAFCSCDFGVAKPDAAVYRAVLDCLGLAAADVLFVDDRPENVAGALEIGLRAHHFTGEAAFRRWLADQGLPLATGT